MENNIFTASQPTADQSHAVFSAVSSNMFLGHFMQPGIMGRNAHEQITEGSPLPLFTQDELLNNLCMPNSCQMLNNRSYLPEGHSRDIDMGASLPATSLANLSPSSVDSISGQNLFSTDSSTTSAFPLNMRSIDSCNSFDTSYQISRNHNHGVYDGPGTVEALKLISTVHPSYHVMGSAWPGWNLHNSSTKIARTDNYLLPRNELSLSLGSCQPSLIGMPEFANHYSENSCSVVTQVTPKDSEELSLYCGSSTSLHFSQIHLGSRYIDVAQKVLAEFVNYALRGSEESDDSLGGIEGEARVSFSSTCSRPKDSPDVGPNEDVSSGEIKSQDNIHYFALEKHKIEETKLVIMLQMVDHRYNQLLDHMQNVITTFHDATNSRSPQILARFALQTVTSAFKQLRGRITRQILLASQEGSKECTRAKDKSSESSFSARQCGLQLGRKDHQSWRPQRGLPERSVSVLRAWMFQNFLHPYPKDNDKHLLAMQSGLTRSQVSNWFINARVRLWKPMIEEMYCEIRRHQTEEGIEGGIGIHGNISNQRPRGD